MFNNYAIVQGVDQVVPVDVYAPGCPPAPETLMHAIVTLHGMIETGELTAPARGDGRRRRACTSSSRRPARRAPRPVRQSSPERAEP